MNTLEAIAKRVSVRKYKSEQISEEALEKIIKAGCAAPMAMARYDSLHITVVQNEEVLKQVMDTTAEFVSKVFGEGKSMNFGEKTLIIVSSVPAMVPGMEYTNVGCVIENMLLAATDLGIASIIWGACAVAVDKNEELKKTLGIPEGFKPLMCASFGYAEKEEPAKTHHIAVTRV